MDRAFGKLRRGLEDVIAKLSALLTAGEWNLYSLKELTLLDSEFEETSKLRLKYTTSVLKARVDKFNEVLKAVSKLDEEFGSAIKNVVENSNRIDPKVIGNELREVERKLESSEKSGKEAEKLLREAKKQGPHLTFLR